MPVTPETWLSEFTVNTTTTNTQFEPRIIQLTNGNVVVAWTSFDDTGAGAPNGTDIIGQMYDAYGNAIGGETRLNNGFFVDNERDFDIAALDNGRFVVVYEDENGSLAGQSIIASEWTTTTSGFGTATDRTIATTPDAGDIVRTPTVTAASDGSYTVGFERFDSSVPDNDLRFINVSSTGTLGTEFTAVSGNDSASSEVDSARLTNGDVVFVYDYHGTDDAIAYSVRNPVTGASTTGGAFVANTAANGDNDQSASVVALTGGGFVIAWQNTDANDTDIEMQRYDNAGVAQGGIINVDVGGSTNNNNEVELVALADGGFLVLWDDDESGALAGRGQRYSSTGATIGSQFVFDSTNANHTEAVLLDDGRVQLVWQDGEIRSLILDTRDNANTVLGSSGLQTGTIGDDTFTAASFATVVNAWKGNDTVTSAGTTKEYLLDDGNDRMNVVSVINADSFDGGAGNDTIDWSAVNETGATFDLGAGTATDVSANVEAMTNFENLIGTNNADSIIGTNGANLLDGGGGNDDIDGGSGNDTLIGGAGDDTLEGGGGVDSLDGGSGNDTFIQVNGWTGGDTYDGGTGTDTFDWSGTSTFDVTANLATGAWTGGGGPLTMISIENMIDNAGNGTLTGSSVANLIEGRAGNDTIDGESGADTLIGGAGDDSLVGGSGADSLIGGDDNDTLVGGLDVDDIDGGAGNDLILGTDGNFLDNTNGGAGTDTLDITAVTQVGGDTFDFDAGTMTTYGGTLDLISIEVFLDGAGSNLIIDSIGALTVDAGAGNDTVREHASGGADDFDLGAGEDLLEINNLGIGGDIFDGGTGNDTVDFSNITYGPGVVIDLGAGTITLGVSSEVLVNFENVNGSQGSETLIGTGGNNQMSGNAGDDTLFGYGGNDTLSGNDGNDVVRGNAGDDIVGGEAGNDSLFGGENNDSLYGGSGNDTLNGGSGDDLFNGGANFDTADYSNETGDIVVNINFAGAQNVSATAGIDTFVSIEGITGGSGNDLLVGNGAGNVIDGGGGNDEIYGLGGGDILRGGTGNDLIEGSGGNDTMEGGAGDADVLSYYNSAGAVTVNLRFQGSAQAVGGSSGTDLFTEFEDLYGSNVGNDTLVGSTEDNTILGFGGNDLVFGFDGNDELIGMQGADTLVGGQGADILRGGGGADHFDFNVVSESTTGTRDTITDFGIGGVGDLIDVSTIDANTLVGGNQVFSFIGGAAFSAAGQLRFVTNGTDGFVLGDVNGDLVHDLEIRVSGTTSMTAGDFIL